MEKQESKSNLKKSKSTKKSDGGEKKTVVDDKEGLVQPIEVAELSNAALVWEITKQLGGTVSGDMLNSGMSSLMPQLVLTSRHLPPCSNERAAQYSAAWCRGLRVLRTAGQGCHAESLREQVRLGMGLTLASSHA